MFHNSQTNSPTSITTSTRVRQNLFSILRSDRNIVNQHIPKMPTSRIVRGHLVASLGEFIGTFLFPFITFSGTQVAFAGSSKFSSDVGPELIQLLYIALSFGFSLAVNVWLFFRISGGLFNPVVSGPAHLKQW